MNKAQNLIRKIIAEKGFIEVDLFFEIASSYYYSNRDPFGKAGDFITAPEVSQLFGEMVGMWCATSWIQLNKPKFTLVEMGGGRGTLMKDLLRSIKNVNGMSEAIDAIFMIETSDHLKSLQQQTLKDHQVNWVQNIQDVKANNCIFICNELFDALSSKQFIKTKNGFVERLITIKDGEFIFIQGDVVDVNSDQFNEGDILEVSPISQYLSELIKSISIAALIIDYGYLKYPKKSTLQAVKNNRHSKLFDDIGDADLTFHVDFIAVQKCFENSTISSQRDFLQNFGINTRAEALIANGYDPKKMQLDLDRLTANEQMGELFKVLQWYKT